MSFPKVPEPHDTPRTIVPSGFALPSSSADFNLFPKSNRSSRRRASYSPPRSETGLSNSLSQSELTRLRSSAFWELHQSITENGEGFVQRMRDSSSACVITNMSARVNHLSLPAEDAKETFIHKLLHIHISLTLMNLVTMRMRISRFSPGICPPTPAPVPPAMENNLLQWLSRITLYEMAIRSMIRSIINSFIEINHPPP